jgi:hypothetical protein
MQVPIERLLNLPDIQVLSVEITEREIRCDIEIGTSEITGQLFLARFNI